MKRSRIQTRGKRTKAWEAARRQLKCQFTAMGIVSCELGLSMCRNDQCLSFAHTLKRRNMKDINRVVLLCIPCHDFAERLGESRMEKLLEDVIADREKRMAEYETAGRNAMPMWAQEILKVRDLTDEEWLAARHSRIVFPEPLDPSVYDECTF